MSSSAALISEDVIADAVAWRRRIHQQPELAFQEQGTSDLVVSLLQSFGLQVHRGLGVTGVVATLRRGSTRRTIGIRADMDALPIQELNEAGHASNVPGHMHACGHDGHTAIALAAARVCAGLPGLDGTVHFIFQPAEEGQGGARRMIAEGLFELFPCDSIFGLHNQPALPVGTCVARDGVMMAACALFQITITGRGCHGGRPHQGVDPLLAGCQLVSALQSIVSRNVDPVKSAVVSATQFRAGDNFNVIADTCSICGTVRWFDDEVGDLVEARIRDLSNCISAGFGCVAQVKYERRFTPTINDNTAAELLRSVAATVPGLSVQNLPPSTGSEDFSDMLRVVPGCYLWLGGGRTDSDPGLHSPRYDFNDDLVPLGVALWVALVQRCLGAGAS